LNSWLATVLFLLAAPMVAGLAFYLSSAPVILPLGALAVGVLGVVFFGGIRLAGMVARESRLALILLFAPGLFITMVAAAVIVLAQAALLLLATYWVWKALNLMLLVIPFLLSIAAAGGAIVAVVRCVLLFPRASRSETVGVALDRQSAPELWKHVENLAGHMDTRAPSNIVFGLEPSFWVMQSPVACGAVRLRGRTLFCSLPLMALLSVQEFDALVCHELAHFKGLDTLFSRFVRPVFVGAGVSLASIRGTTGGWRAATLLPAFILLEHFLESFQAAEARVSRRRETTADAESARFAGVDAASGALVKTHVFESFWNEVEVQLENAVKTGTSFSDFTRRFVDFATVRHSDQLVKAALDRTKTHPLDSHPPLSARLTSLRVDVEKIRLENLETDRSASAMVLVAGFGRIEAELCKIHYRRAAERLGVFLKPD
jgi:Zn-dependent protease with chaperone function